MGSPVTSADVCAAVAGPTESVCAQLKALFSIAQLLCTYFQWAYDSNGNPTPELLANLVALSVPTGTVVFRPVSIIPDGYLEANGQAVSRTDYAALYLAYGTQFGAGDTTTTFNLPNMQDKTALGSSGSKPVASTGGNENITLTASQLPAHVHPITTKRRVDLRDGGGSGALDIPTSAAGAATTFNSDANTPAGSPVNILPSYVAGKWLVKT